MHHKTSSIISAAALTALAATALVGSPSVAVGASLYQPGAGPQLGGAPYVRPGFTIYPPGSPNLPPQFTNPEAHPYPPGAQTCVAALYTCPAPAPNTPGNACTCPTNAVGTAPGIVH